MSGLVERVTGDMHHWAGRFVAGKMHWRSIVCGRRPLRPEELMGGLAGFVASRQVPAEPSPDDLSPGPRRGIFPTSIRAEGPGIVTSERFLIKGRGCSVHKEWSWDSLSAVAVRGWDAAVLTPTDQAGTATAVLWIPLTNSIGRPSRVQVLEKMLRIEGAFHISRGDGDAWLSALPMRFGRLVG